MSQPLIPQFIRYAIGHSKKYSKSPVADFLIDSHGDSENDICLCNDIKLLLREKNLHKKIGSDLLRDYVESLQKQSSLDSEHVNFSDEELFQLIEPKDINNLTTSYLYAKYIKDNESKLKSRYDDILASKKHYDAYIKKRDDIVNTLKD